MVDPLASRVEMAALVAGGACVCACVGLGYLGVCICVCGCEICDCVCMCLSVWLVGVLPWFTSGGGDVALLPCLA